MIHPLKAATSFDCDGCGHHASFHQLQNPQEEETVKRWREEASYEALKGRDPVLMSTEEGMQAMVHIRRKGLEQRDRFMGKEARGTIVNSDEDDGAVDYGGRRDEQEEEVVPVGVGRGKRKRRG